MNSIMTEMLKKYQENGDTDKKNAIKDTASLDLWSADFFKQITNGLR